jgi:alkylated DNA repair protein alkB homolog 7
MKQGHYDGVIKHFREMHISSWSQDTPGLQSLLHRIRQFHPDEETQTHLLHLASKGDIRPHVDHLSAFGSWIVGVSLGTNRILRLEKVELAGTPPIDIILPSGSLYIQKYDVRSFNCGGIVLTSITRDSVRYDYKHSILVQKSSNGQEPRGGQRLSIMIRASTDYS